MRCCLKGSAVAQGYKYNFFRIERVCAEGRAHVVSFRIQCICSASLLGLTKESASFWEAGPERGLVLI